MWRLCENVSHDTTVWYDFTCVWSRISVQFQAFYVWCDVWHLYLYPSMLPFHTLRTVSHVCIVGLMTAIQNNIIRFIAIKLELFNYDFLWGFYCYPVECVCLRSSEIDSKQIQKHKATMTTENTNEIQFNIFCPLSGVNQQFFWRNGFVCRSSET